MAQNKYFSDSIFWVEVDRIKPNPYQPRRTFNEDALRGLAESIRQYGVLQPLTVVKKEIERPDEGISVEYELIAGERRLRASKMAGVSLVPVVIRNPEEGDKMKLEIAIIENLQREDLNAVDRGRAFQKLADDFGMVHSQIAQKIGKSREYVSNTIRILSLPEEFLNALVAGTISDGHTRPLLMLADRPEEQKTLFREIVDTKMSVRESERVARRIAVDKTRKHDLTPELLSMEREFTERLGTRVRIERKENGGKVLIDFFSSEDLEHLRSLISNVQDEKMEPQTEHADAEVAASPLAEGEGEGSTVEDRDGLETGESEREVAPQSEQPQKELEDDIYSVRNFTL